MCTPVAGVAAGVGLLQIVGQTQQAKALGQHQRNVAERTRVNAAAASTTAYEGYLARSQQIRQSAAEATTTASREASRALSTARAGQAELSGSTPNDLVQSISQQAGDHQALLDRNLEWGEAQIIRQLEGVRAQEQNRNLGAMGGPIKGPDYVAILGNVATIGAGEYMDSLKKDK